MDDAINVEPRLRARITRRIGKKAHQEEEVTRLVRRMRLHNPAPRRYYGAR